MLFLYDIVAYIFYLYTLQFFPILTIPTDNFSLVEMLCKGIFDCITSRRLQGEFRVSREEEDQRAEEKQPDWLHLGTEFATFSHLSVDYCNKQLL